MTSDHTRARISAALLVVGTLTGVVLSAGPVLVVRKAVEQHGVSVDGSAVVAPAFLSAVAALLVSLAGWHRSFVGNESWMTRTRSHQVAARVIALILAATWSLSASGAEYPAGSLIAATVLPLVPGVAVVVLGILIATLLRGPLPDVGGAALLGLGLLATVTLEPAFLGWALLCACLFVTSQTLRPRRDASAEPAQAKA
jgi:cell division protein FtsW (lipid II flippase)